MTKSFLRRASVIAISIAIGFVVYAVYRVFAPGPEVPEEVTEEPTLPSPDFTAPMPTTQTAQSEVPTPSEFETLKEQKIREAVEQVLSSESPRGYQSIPSGVKLLSVKVEEISDDKIPLRITLNFSEELLSQGTGYILEDSLHQIIVGIENKNPWIKDVEYVILVEGEPIKYD